MSDNHWIETLRTACRTEGASAVFLRNTVSTLAWSGLSEERRARAAEQLNALADGAARRAARLARMLASAQGREGRDVH